MGAATEDLIVDGYAIESHDVPPWITHGRQALALRLAIAGEHFLERMDALAVVYGKRPG